MFSFPVTLFSGETFSPADVAGLALWLDADDASTLFQDAAGSTPATADADPVGRWADKSGNARHVTQGTSSQRPSLKHAAQAGRNVVMFDGVDDYLSRTAMALNELWSASAATMFFVLRRNSAGGADGLIEHQDTSTNAVRIWAPYSDNKLYYDHGSYSGGGRVSGSKPVGYDDAWHVLESYRSGSTAEILLDGSTTIVSGTMSDSLDSLTNTATVTLGCHAGLLGPLMAHVAELCVWPSGLSAADRALMRAYLKAKWGTP